MDNFENKPLEPSQTNHVQAELEALRHLLISVLVLVIVVSGTLNIYLLRQWRSSSQDLKAIRPQVAQMVAEYQKVSGPVIGEFERKLVEFSRTNPDFAQVLAKYGLKPSNAPSLAPAPANKK